MSPRKRAEIAASRIRESTGEEEAAALIARRIMQATVLIELPESAECCPNCGARITNMPLSGATIHVDIV